MKTSLSSVSVAGQPLPRADEEGHAGPAPVLDLEPERRVRLGGRVRRDSVDVEVAVVLTAHVVSRIGGDDGAEERDLGVLDRVGVTAGGNLHRRGRDDLHQVVDDDVAQRADRVVEVAAILDAEVLGHRDLDGLEVVTSPDRLEHRVREPEVEDLLEPHLPEVVVDPVELRLVDVLVQLGRRARVAEARSWPNGFSTTTRALSVSPASESPWTTRPNRNGGISR